MFTKILKILTAVGAVICVIAAIMANQGNLKGALLMPIGLIIGISAALILFFRWAYGKLFKVSKKMITEAINDADGGEPKIAGMPMPKGKMAEKAKEKLEIASPPQRSSHSSMPAETIAEPDISEMQLTRTQGRQCANCGALLDDDDDFCPECGMQYILPKIKRCIRCGEELEPDEDYCPYCGQKYIDPDLRICRNCGAKVKPRASFCGKCGTRYEEEA